MSRYVLTQEQLDRLQDQIQQLSKLNDAKQERIRELELHKIHVSGADKAELVKTIGKLEDEIIQLKKENLQLELLLAEEQKLRKYSENFAKQVELKCAEETLLRELTTELCQLQKAEIEIDNKRIEELQHKLGKFTEEMKIAKEKERKQSINRRTRDSILRLKQVKYILDQLKNQLYELQNEVVENPIKTKQDRLWLREVEKWLREIAVVGTDVNDIENLEKDLKYLEYEIESKRPVSLDYQN